MLMVKNTLIAAAIVATLTSASCTSHKQIACRFVAVDGHGNILKTPTANMHSHWHPGVGNCAGMIQALETGLVTETVTGDQAGVEVKGSKAERLRLKQLFDPLPLEPLNTTEVRPRFKKLMEVAE
jgi:hypothetical protein